MSTPETRWIWPPETGITDIEGDPQALAVSQIDGIRAAWQEQRDRLKGTERLSSFIEKMSREWAIETGVIENLYDIDRGVTQTLIEHGLRAELIGHGDTNKPPEYVLRLVRDQKDALDGVFDFVKDKRQLTTSYIKELHVTMLRNQDTTEARDAAGRKVDVRLLKGEWKRQPNSPQRGGVIYNYCPPEQVASEMDRLIEIYNAHLDKETPSEATAAWLHHRFTQIHPFQDGNGRVVRALASLVFIKDGLFPLVVTRDSRSEYIDALEKADSGDLKPLIDLFAELQLAQFVKAAGISKVLKVEEGVQAELYGLGEAASQLAKHSHTALEKVIELARAIEDDLEKHLNAIRPTVEDHLRQAFDNANASVRRSCEDTNHYFRSQVIATARGRRGYPANTSVHQSWVELDMKWSRRAKLVFAIHGIGNPFSGGFICAPFFEFIDIDEEDQPMRNLIPLAEKKFIFFNNEDRDRLLERFAPWRDAVLKVALRGLAQNL